MALDTYALTTLTKYKRFRKSGTTDSDTSKDDYFERLIDSASAAIESHLSRKVLARNYHHWLTVPNGNTFLPPEYPVIRVTGAWYGDGTAFTVSRSSSGLLSASVTVTDSSVILSSITTAGVETSTTLAFATYPSVSTLVTAIGAVSGWTATTVAHALSQFLRPTSYNALGTTTAVAYASTRADVTVDPTGRRLSVPAAKGRLTLLQYRAGYETVPYDIEQACLLIATALDKNYGDLKDASTVPEWEQGALLLYPYRRVPV